MSIPTGTFEIDPVHSDVGFTVRHAGIAKVRGRFTDVSGTIVVADPFADSSVNVRIGSGSVSTHDKRRDDHLVSPDFWDAANKPTWTFVSRKVIGEGDAFHVEGDLTINDVTRAVALAVEYNGEGSVGDGVQRIAFTSALEISRKEYGLTWNAVTEGGGLLISDVVRIWLEVTGVKQG